MKRFLVLLLIALSIVACEKGKNSDNTPSSGESEIAGVWICTKLAIPKNAEYPDLGLYLDDYPSYIVITSDHKGKVYSDGDEYDVTWTMEGDKFYFVDGDGDELIFAWNYLQIDGTHACFHDGTYFNYFTNITKLLSGNLIGIRGENRYKIKMDASGTSSWSGSWSGELDWTFEFEGDKVVLAFSGSKQEKYTILSVMDDVLVTKRNGSDPVFFAKEQEFSENDFPGYWQCHREYWATDLAYTLAPSVSCAFTSDHKGKLRWWEGEKYDYTWTYSGQNLTFSDVSGDVDASSGKFGPEEALVLSLTDKHMCWLLHWKQGHYYIHNFTNIRKILPGTWTVYGGSEKYNVTFGTDDWSLDFSDNGLVMVKFTGSGGQERFEITDALADNIIMVKNAANKDLILVRQ